MARTDIVGYTYRADNYCPGCIIGQMVNRPEFDGWALGEGIVMSTEENLAEIAMAFGIDRMDERSYDSGDFPKVIFRDSLESNEEGEPETCGQCGTDLEDE